MFLSFYSPSPGPLTLDIPIGETKWYWTGAMGLVTLGDRELPRIVILASNGKVGVQHDRDGRRAV